MNSELPSLPAITEGTVLDILVQRRRNKWAALKLLRKLLRNQGIRAAHVARDKPKSYDAAFWDVNLSNLHETGHRLNNLAESSRVPIRRRERKMQCFNLQKTAQRFLSTHGPIYNLSDLRICAGIDEPPMYSTTVRIMVGL